jgi:hypothetical protein
MPPTAPLRRGPGGGAQKWTPADLLRIRHEAEQALAAEAYVELAFEAQSSGIDVDDATRSAAEAYDKLHVSSSGQARKHLIETQISPSDLWVAKASRDLLTECMRNRYFKPEKVELGRPSAGAAVRRKRRHAGWQLSGSCWAGRMPDMFESSENLRPMFERDWDVCVRSHELGKTILKCYHEATTWRGLDWEALLLDSAEVSDAREALWMQPRVLFGAFDHYAALYSEGETSPGEPDVFNISFNAYMHFVETCRMVSRRTPYGEFETILAIVNATDRATAAEEAHFNAANTLNRQEFMQCLVRIAILLFVKRGGLGDVSLAIRQLYLNHLVPNLPPGAMQNSNAFRKRFCYNQQVSRVLELNMGTLRSLYESYAEASDDMRDRLKDASLMSVGEWLAFVRHVGLVESEQLSVGAAKNIFLWSRIRTLRDRSERAEGRLRHMHFLDFLEALVRVSIMSAMPTDMDLSEAGATDAGEFLLAMQANAPKAYRSFLETHRPQFQDPDGSDYETHALQPVWRCVDHMLKLIVRTIEHATSARNDASAADGIVQSEEAAKFLKQRAAGLTLETISSHSAGGLASVDFAEALDSSKARMITIAAALKIQMANRARRARNRVAERRKLAREQQPQS